MSSFRFDGQRLTCGVHGRGLRTTVILPGLPLSQKMQVPLARALAREGNRVITFDPLGHGGSARPTEPWRSRCAPLLRSRIMGGRRPWRAPGNRR